MKNIRFLLITVFTLSLLTNCIDDDNDELTGGALTGGLITLTNPAIGYVVGNDATYTANAKLYQGDVATTSVDVYVSFTDSQTGETSNEVLLETIPISQTQPGTVVPITVAFSYEGLINNLTLNGSPLPESDSDLNIGDFWTLRFESTTSNGNVVSNAAVTKVSVGTRFAGVYRTLTAQYYRLGVLTATGSDWPAETVIESVDATTYRVVEYFGYFSGNEWYFQIDENDRITYPAETPAGDAQTGNGQPFITCESNPADFAAVNLPCGANSNYVERDDVNGADKLYMTFGYLTPGSGPRVFYQVLEKIVE